jgi:hypothetical protein
MSATVMCHHVLVPLDESPRPSARLSACLMCGEVSDFDPQPIARSAGVCSMSTRALGEVSDQMQQPKTGRRSRAIRS